MTTDSSIYCFGSILIEPAQNQITVGGERRSLKPRAMDVLVYLIQHNNRVVSSEELLEKLWAGRVTDESTVHRLISQLRGALGDSSTHPSYIKTVTKRGYQAIAEITLPEADTVDPSPNVMPRFFDRWSAQAKLVALASMVLIAGLLYVASQSRLSESMPGPATLPVIAVLPFSNLSEFAENDFFAAGVHEDLLTSLSEIPGLAVISRTSVLRYREHDLSMQEIARELKVDYVVEGSVRRQNQQVRISVQLIDASNDRHLWAQTYDRDLSDTFAIQSEITRQVAGQLSLQLIEKKALAYNPATNDLLFEARELLRRRSSESRTQALELLRLARTIDPSDARVHSAIAETLLLQTLQNVSWPEVSEELTRSIDVALQLDPNLASTRLTLAQVQLSRGNVADAEENYQLAIRLAPNDADILMMYGQFLSDAKLLRDVALPHLRRAVELNPYFGEAWALLASNLMRSGKLDESYEALQEGFRRAPQDDHLMRIQTEYYLFSGNRIEAIRHLSDLVRQDRESLADIALLIDRLARIGFYAEAGLWLDEMHRINPTHIITYTAQTQLLWYRNDWSALARVNDSWAQQLPGYVIQPLRNWKLGLMQVEADALWKSERKPEALRIYQDISQFLLEEARLPARLDSELPIIDNGHILWLANMLAHALIRSDRSDEAIALLNRIAEVKGPGGDTLINKAIAQAMLGNEDEAIANFIATVNGPAEGEFGIHLFMDEQTDWLNGINRNPVILTAYQRYLSELSAVRQSIRQDYPQALDPAANPPTISR